MATKARNERGSRQITYKRFKEGVDYEASSGDELNALLDVAIANFERMLKRNGRPPAFESVEDLQAAIKSYFEYVRDINADESREFKIYPDVEGLAAYLGVSRTCINDWENSNYNGFSATIKTAKNLIADYKKQLAMHGKIPPIIAAMDFNNNHGYTQKQEVLVTPNSPLQADTNPVDIASKYNALPED